MNPYQVLGVSQTADEDIIKKAYRKAAKECHPDTHPGDKRAEERFKDCLLYTSNIIYSNPKQAVLPMLIQDYLDICDPVLTFDRFMGEIELEKYLKNIPQHYTGRLRYDPVSMLKTVLFGFMANGYISLRELEDQCKVNLRFMYLMDHQAPSYRTFGYFINEVLADSIEEIFQDINKKIFETEHVDLQHLYIDGSKFEANANKYSWVWKKATEKSR